MKFSAILSSTVLASAALASPLTSQRRARNAARLQARTAQRHSNFPFKEGTSQILHLNETTHEDYSSNWAGAVLIGSGYTSVTGTFTVPNPSVPSGGSSSEQYCASAWVGIDGDTCSTAILQTGVDFCVDSSGPSFDAWYEWYPDYAYDFSGISFSVGDSVKVTVDASSKSGGTATIENLSTGKTVSHSFSGESANPLCETNAEWILEDFSSGSSLVPFANFGTVTFTDISVTSGGSSSGASGATLIDIKQNGAVLTSSSASDSEVTVQYVG
ncbi:peptidase A4 family-domain-containing protein [Aspergillus bertholletiae]|uniref:Peptidase A4 family-domain-containing protein n=1 Tax=Aspergillus bertholletiae TaxID=1226010 RepID=A0A5N7B6W5_9EURO|nr:peptidase A4 family-domain-containing protein [Aspergillus bertholletiae]